MQDDFIVPGLVLPGHVTITHAESFGVEHAITDTSLIFLLEDVQLVKVSYELSRTNIIL